MRYGRFGADVPKKAKQHSDMLVQRTSTTVLLRVYPLSTVLPVVVQQPSNLECYHGIPCRCVQVLPVVQILLIEYSDM
jgi:hypothetical protein